MVVNNDGYIESVEVGDLVEIRSYKEMYERFGCDETGDIDCGLEVFTTQMVDFCGLVGKVAEIKTDRRGNPTGLFKLTGGTLDERRWAMHKFCAEMVKEPELEEETE